MNTRVAKVNGLFIGVLSGAFCLMSPGGRAQDLYVGETSATVVNASDVIKIRPGGFQSVCISGNYVLGDIAFDRSGNLFVTTGGPIGGGGEVYEYSPGKTRRLFRQLKSGNLGTIAIDSAGNLFVCNSAIDTAGEIYEFSARGQFSVFASGLDDPVDIAFDRDGNLFEADIGDGNIYEFIKIHGALSPKATLFASGLQLPTALAFDAKGNLFVADAGAYSIYEYTRDAVRSTFESGLHEVGALAFDSAGILFAGDGDGNIYKFTREGEPSIFATGFNNPFALAFDPVRSSAVSVLPSRF